MKKFLIILILLSGCGVVKNWQIQETQKFCSDKGGVDTISEMMDGRGLGVCNNSSTIILEPIGLAK